MSMYLTQVKEAHVALKAAGDTRKKENHEFQQVVSDQRATIAILNKALDRLKSGFWLENRVCHSSEHPCSDIVATSLSVSWFHFHDRATLLEG